MENIKSDFFIEIIFKHTNEKTKLKLLKYNKYLQNLIGINIINYKVLSGKYIIFETNGKGKEYDGYENLLIYEGEYQKGERTGIGKEYDYNGTLRFEGEYLKGKRNGKGKEYYDNGKLKFEGEYD